MIRMPTKEPHSDRSFAVFRMCTLIGIFTWSNNYVCFCNGMAEAEELNSMEERQEKKTLLVVGVGVFAETAKANLKLFVWVCV